jgi:steroid delta-isomerase-like uncharacterized protein
MSAENKSLARRALDELWTKGNLAAVDQLYSEKCVFHDLGSPDDIRGRDGLKQFARMYRTACPDLQCTVEDVVAEGDKVAVRWVSRGTHKGDLMGIAPTGKQVTFRGIQMLRISKGKIEEEWAGFNTLGALQEIGAVPRLGQPAAAGR